MARKTAKKQKPERSSRKRAKAHMLRQRIILEKDDPGNELFNQGSFGTKMEDSLIQLSLYETLYLLEKDRLTLTDKDGRKVKKESMLRRATRLDKSFWVNYAVFKDIRTRGYIIKTGLKFGAEFRVYPRGVKPGEDHAKWIVYPVHESEHMTWYEFAAKNRVAHSTKKNLLVGIVDNEGDVTYYEIQWTRP